MKVETLSRLWLRDKNSFSPAS